MLFLIAIAIALCVVLFGGSLLKKHSEVFYIAAAVITVTVIVISRMSTDGALHIDNRLIKEYVIGIFAKGALAGAFWCIVMWAGALPNGSAAIKKIMPIRGELSILAGVISMAHVITYAFNYIRDLVCGRTGGDSALLTFLFCVAAIAMLLIMIPLTVMSFKTIRKKMDAKRWKQIQRAAYIFYAFLYIHIVILYAPKARKGFYGYLLSILVYTAVFASYAAFRVRKWYLKKHEEANKNVTNIICGIFIAAMLGGSAFISYDRTKGDEPAKGPTRERKATATESPDPSEASTEASSEAASSDKQVTSVTTTVTATETTATTVKEDETEASTAATTEDKEAAAETETKAEEEINETAPTTEEKEKNTKAETPTGNTPEPAATEAPTQAATQPPTTEAPTQAAVLKYKNGTFSGSADGYDGKINVSITIENDKIVSISASSEEEEPEYFAMAEDPVISQILAAQDTYVDAVSGATYSSFGIMEAVENAMNSALN